MLVMVGWDSAIVITDKGEVGGAEVDAGDGGGVASSAAAGVGEEEAGLVGGGGFIGVVVVVVGCGVETCVYFSGRVLVSEGIFGGGERVLLL